MAFGSIYGRNPLDKHGDDIRLLEILDGGEKDVVKARFHQCALSKHPAFVALSYTWDAGPETQSIWIDSQEVKIRENLWLFLLRARRRKKWRLQTTWRFLWVDALCIDQTNVLEKNHQVQHMGRIYSEAALTAAWLGDSVDDSDLAIQCIKSWSHFLGTERSRSRGCGLDFVSRTSWRNKLDAVERLLTRSYFSRIWIVQELLLSKNILLLCGEKQLPWFHLQNFFTQASRWTYFNSNTQRASVPRERWISFALNTFRGPARKLVDWRCTTKRNARHWPGEKPSIGLLLMAFGGMQSVETKDRIYALLGLASHETRVEVNYSITNLELFHQMVDILSHSAYNTVESVGRTSYRPGGRTKLETLGLFVEWVAAAARILDIDWFNIDVYKRVDEMQSKWVKCFRPCQGGQVCGPNECSTCRLRSADSPEPELPPSDF